MTEHDNVFKAYSLEITILVAALLVSSTLFVALGNVASSSNALITQLRSGGSAAGSGSGTGANPSGGTAGGQQGPPQPILVNTQGAATKGPENAKITVVEFSDFQCPFCKRAFPTVQQVLREYPNDVKLVYMNYPLSFHQNAQKSAEAFECARDQNKQWEFHDKLFTVGEADGTNLAVADLKRYAQELGVNTATFNQCLDSGQKAALVQQQASTIESFIPTHFVPWQLVDQFGQPAMGTPLFLVNGVPLSGAQPFSKFKQTIDAALAAAG